MAVSAEDENGAGKENKEPGMFFFRHGGQGSLH